MPLAVVVFFLALLTLFFFKTFFRSKQPSLPPGPKGLPLIGNVLDMPAEKGWLTFSQWGETWGQCQFRMLPLIWTNANSP